MKMSDRALMEVLKADHEVSLAEVGLTRARMSPSPVCPFLELRGVMPGILLPGSLRPRLTVLTERT